MTTLREPISTMNLCRALKTVSNTTFDDAFFSSPAYTSCTKCASHPACRFSLQVCYLMTRAHHYMRVPCVHSCVKPAFVERPVGSFAAAGDVRNILDQV